MVCLRLSGEEDECHNFCCVYLPMYLCLISCTVYFVVVVTGFESCLYYPAYIPICTIGYKVIQGDYRKSDAVHITAPENGFLPTLLPIHKSL